MPRPPSWRVSSGCSRATLERRAPREPASRQAGKDRANLRPPKSIFREQPESRAVQPVLPFSSEPKFPATPASWSDVARLCRRICVLREQAKPAEAETLQRQELEPLLENLRSAGDTPLTLDARLAATMAEESDRVANATLLAELLAPMLGARAGANEPKTSVVALRPAPPLEARANAAPLPKPVRTAASIADFLDEMIAQESTPIRPPGPAPRRVS